MHIRTKARGWLAGVAAFTLLAVGTAQAAGDRTVEPLNQYAVSGRVTTDLLARAGYDLNEVKAIGKTGKLGIVATPAQAQAPARQGRDGRARSTRTPARRPRRPTPLTDPVHGYDVFRPWSLKPAPCPDTCSTPQRPAEDVVPRPRVALPRRRQGGRRSASRSSARTDHGLQGHRRTRATRDGARPVTLFESTQHAREWISAEVNRRLFACVHRPPRPTATSSGCCSRTSCGSSRSMNPDGYDYTFTSAEHAPVAQEPARRQRRRRDRPRRRRRRHQPQLAREVELRPRGRL